MSVCALADARLATEALDALSTTADPAATDTELVSVLTVCEGLIRRLDQITVSAVGDLQRRGAFARALGSRAAGRLAPQVWAGAEAAIAELAPTSSPGELANWAAQLIDALATLLDALAQPIDRDDDRPLPQRQAEALGDACGFVLDHGSEAGVPDTGGRRPHLNVLIRLEYLENRARAACLDFAGAITPAALRMLACDCAVVPIVLDGLSQPLDVGRATRTIPMGCVGRWPPGTGAAPGVDDPPVGATSTTSCRGRMQAKPRCPTA